MRLRSAALIVTLIVGILSAPLAAEAQQVRGVPRIGFLSGGSPSSPYGVHRDRRLARLHEVPAPARVHSDRSACEGVAGVCA